MTELSREEVVRIAGGPVAEVVESIEADRYFKCDVLSGTMPDVGTEFYTEAQLLAIYEAGAKSERAVSDRLLDALTDISMAGMSDVPDATEESTTRWHARRAWEFIGIAARAVTEVRAMRKENKE